MNLYSKFVQYLQDGKKQFVVIGLGRFGLALCEILYHQGHEVLGIDTDEKTINQALADNIVSHAMQLDSTDRTALEEAGVFEFKTAIVAIGNFVEASVITTLNLKEAGVPFVLAKASSDIHEKVLKKVGADRVLFPEREMGRQLAKNLTKPHILDRFDLDPENTIAEAVVPEEFAGKTLADLNMRSRYGLNVIAVGYEGDDNGREERFEVNPEPDTRLYRGMAMVVVGKSNAVDRLPH